MNLAEVRNRAEVLGINTGDMKKMSKTELIHTIQFTEGHTTCYATRTDNCPYVLCCFMADCYKEAKARQKKASGTTKKASAPKKTAKKKAPAKKKAAKKS